MLPNACRSLLAFAFVFSISCGNLALADSLIVDDWDPSLQWNGGWIGLKDEPAPSWDRTLTWGNISSATVTLTFTGTSIQVFGAFKPVGVWSMQSQYAIDGGSPTTFVPPQEVSEEAYNQSFYHSGSLPEGEHTLKITNLGAQLWLDYFLVNDGGGVNVVFSSGGSSYGASPTTTTATVTESATISPSAGTTHVSTGSTTPPTSSAPNLPTQLNASVSATNSSFPCTTSPSASGSSDGSPSSPLTSSPSPSSSDGTAPSRGAGATQGPSSGTSHAVPAGLIAGVTIGGLAVLAVLLAVWWHCRRKLSGLSAWVAPYPFSRPPGPDALSRTETSFYAHDASLRKSQHSATLLIGPRASRRASSLADFVDSYSYAHGERSPQSPYADRSPQSPYADRYPHSVYGGYWSTLRRSTDGGVTIAGGPGLDGGGDAPSILEVQSIKSKLPPVYQAYNTAGRSG
ncbi:hypothetical protein V8D89_000922 [Ganoderma adspersum]